MKILCNKKNYASDMKIPLFFVAMLLILSTSLHAQTKFNTHITFKFTPAPPGDTLVLNFKPLKRESSSEFEDIKLTLKNGEVVWKTNLQGPITLSLTTDDKKYYAGIIEPKERISISVNKREIASSGSPKLALKNAIDQARSRVKPVYSMTLDKITMSDYLKYCASYDSALNSHIKIIDSYKNSVSPIVFNFYKMSSIKFIEMEKLYLWDKLEGGFGMKVLNPG